MGHWTLTIFYFLLFFLILLFFFFILFSWKDNEEGMWQGSHMTCHMVWHHKPRTWWKGLEDDVRAYGTHMMTLSRTWGVKIVDSGLYFILPFFFVFYFSCFLFFLSFLFLFLEQLRLGLIGHTVTSVTSWWQSHKTNHETWENLVEDSRTNDVIQHGHHMLTSWATHGCLG